MIPVKCYVYATAQCPANEEQSASSGVILSPGFPKNYPNSQTCSWIIRVQPSFTIAIYVEMFQSEKQFDELEIFDGRLYFILFYSILLTTKLHNTNMFGQIICEPFWLLLIIKTTIKYY